MEYSVETIEKFKWQYQSVKKLRLLRKMLLNRVIGWAWEKNALNLELGVTVRDSLAMRLYTRLGFEAVGEAEPLRPGSALFCQSMRLKLENK